jgi:hypothetical protein
MRIHLLFATAIFGSLGGSLCVADDGSARRYAEFAETNNLSRMFALLERKDVQDELKITPEQAAKVAHICRAPEREIPGLRDLVVKHERRQAEPGASSADREKEIASFNLELGKRIAEYQRKQLSATLSSNQMQRLGELVLQMRGPIALMDDPAILAKLRISEKQKLEMADTIKHYEEESRWLRARFGRQQISGIHMNEHEKDRQREIDAMFVVLRAIEKDRDADLLTELTPDQLESWRRIQGKLFQIAWPPTSVLDSPFEEKK